MVPLQKMWTGRNHFILVTYSYLLFEGQWPGKLDFNREKGHALEPEAPARQGLAVPSWL